MSGSIASRYIGGVPYGPGRSVGRYPNRASVGVAPGVVPVPGVNPDPIVRPDPAILPPPVVPPPAAAPIPEYIQPPPPDYLPVGGVGDISGGQDAAGGGNNMLASVLLGLLGAAPDLYRAGSELFGGDRVTQASDELPLPPDQMPPPEIPGATPYGTSDQYGQLWGVPADGQEGLHSLYDSQGRSLGSIDLMQGADDFGDLGAFDPGEGTGLAPTEGMVPGDGGSLVPADGAGALAGETNWIGLPTEAVSVGDMGLGSVGGFNAGNLAYIPAAVFAHGTSTLAKPGGELGAQIGSGLGMIIGGALAGPFGAAAGAVGGGAIGGQIGPAPTIGRNFSAIGTFNGDGTIGWGNAGGDNGGDANGAMDFANWFGSDLMQEAAAQGLQFNPNMSGAQFRVGGYDNFNRTAQTPGGYFYTPDTGGSPENYALRPDSSWDSDPYSGAQADAFSQNVLADLTARGVFTQAGANQPGLDFYGSSQGAPLGWYGGGAGQGSYGSDGNPLAGGFGAILGDRQGAVQGYINQQQAQGAANAAAQQVLGNAFDPFNSYDPNYGWQQMAAAMPQGAAPSGVPDIYAGLTSGMQGVQMTENGPIWAPMNGVGPGFVQADGGA